MASRAAQTTLKSLPKSRLAVRSLYREIYRATPEILQKYEIQDITPGIARANIAAQFRRFGDVTDVNVAEVLRQKGVMDLHEAERMFKTRSHIYKTVSEAAPKQKKSEFLDSFFSGSS